MHALFGFDADQTTHHSGGHYAAALRGLQLCLTHFSAWRRAWVLAAALRKATATKHAVLLSWRGESERRGVLRMRLAERRRDAAAAAGVRAWRGATQ